MGVASPELMDGAFTEMFNARDREGLMGLFEPGVVFTMEGESKAVGLAQVAAALNGFLDAPLRFSGKYVNCYISGDTALMRMRWKLENEKEGTGTEAVSVEVLRRGSDGKWRLLLDDATGGSRA